MRKKNHMYYKLIEMFGEENLDDYIKNNDILYDEELTSPIKSTEDLEYLTTEQLKLFTDEYEEYLDNTTLDEDELKGWNDIVENINKD